MWAIKLSVISILLILAIHLDNLHLFVEGEEICPSKSETIQRLSEKFDDFIEKYEKNRKADDEKYEKNRKADDEKYEKNRKADDEKNERNRKADDEKNERNRKADDEKNERNRKADDKKNERNRKADKEYLYKLLKERQHDIHSEVANHLNNVTVHITDSTGRNYNSGHYIFYEQRFMLLSVSHGVQIRDSFSCHTEIDVQISGGCPVNSAINVSTSAPLRTGDQASTFGFINENDQYIARFWKGSLAGELGYLKIDNATKTRFLNDEYVFQGVAQLIGMSGGPTVNGVGYTGMVHGNNEYFGQNVSMACVIPFNLIKSKCIDKMRDEAPALFAALNTTSDCKSANVIKTPQF